LDYNIIILFYIHGRYYTFYYYLLIIIYLLLYTYYYHYHYYISSSANFSAQDYQQIGTTAELPSSTVLFSQWYANATGIQPTYYTGMYVCMYVFMWIYIYIYTYIYVFLYMYICIYTHFHRYICIYLYTYLYVHSYIFIYVYTYKVSLWGAFDVLEKVLYTATQSEKVLRGGSISPYDVYLGTYMYVDRCICG
jgi:hypothetical protein